MNKFVVMWEYPEGKLINEIVAALQYHITDSGDLLFVDVIENDEDDKGEPTFIPVRSFAQGIWIKVALAGTFGKEVENGQESA